MVFVNNPANGVQRSRSEPISPRVTEIPPPQ